MGASRANKIDVRVVGATNVGMLDAIKNGKFREDLYYRLNTVEINLPPLRERPADIHLLFESLRRISPINTTTVSTFRRRSDSITGAISLAWKHSSTAQPCRANECH